MAKASKLPLLTRCPGWYGLEEAQPRGGPISQAALFGIALGKAAERFHRGDPLPEILEELERDAPESERAKALKIFGAYILDPRNRDGVDHGEVIPESLEGAIRFTLPSGVELVGLVDQVRRGSDGRLRIWDLKAGKPDGLELLYAHALQLAAYARGWSERTGEETLVGGIMRLRDYARPRGGRPIVFYEADWGPETYEILLATLDYELKTFASNRILLRPGPHCVNCPGQNPAACPTMIRERIFKEKLTC